MNKALMTAATLAVLLTTSAFAQRYGYPAQPNNYPQQPGYNQPGYNQQSGDSRYNQRPGYNQPNYNYDYDDSRFDRHLDWWDRELNLTRRQEREIRRIRDRFTQQSQSLNPRDSRPRDTFRQLRQRQFIDMMAVLNVEQRDRVMDRMRPYERSSGRSYGTGNGSGYSPYGY